MNTRRHVERKEREQKRRVCVKLKIEDERE